MDQQQFNTTIPATPELPSTPVITPAEPKKNSAKFWIIGIVALIIIAGVAAFFFVSPPKLYKGDLTPADEFRTICRTNNGTFDDDGGCVLPSGKTAPFGDLGALNEALFSDACNAIDSHENLSAQFSPDGKCTFNGTGFTYTDANLLEAEKTSVLEFANLCVGSQGTWNQETLKCIWNGTEYIGVSGKQALQIAAEEAKITIEFQNACIAAGGTYEDAACNTEGMGSFLSLAELQTYATCIADSTKEWDASTKICKEKTAAVTPPAPSTPITLETLCATEIAKLNHAVFGDLGCTIQGKSYQDNAALDQFIRIQTTFADACALTGGGVYSDMTCTISEAGIFSSLEDLQQGVENYRACVNDEMKEWDVPTKTCKDRIVAAPEAQPELPPAAPVVSSGGGGVSCDELTLTPMIFVPGGDAEFSATVRPSAFSGILYFKHEKKGEMVEGPAKFIESSGKVAFRDLTKDSKIIAYALPSTGDQCTKIALPKPAPVASDVKPSPAAPSTATLKEQKIVVKQEDKTKQAAPKPLAPAEKTTAKPITAPSTDSTIPTATTQIKEDIAPAETAKTQIESAASAEKSTADKTATTSKASAANRSAANAATSKAKAEKLHGSYIQGDTGPGVLLYPLLIGIGNGVYYWVRRKKSTEQTKELKN